MASTHKHIRSGTANKRPTTAIADGQIALNTNLSSPGLFFKDSTGAEILKIGPVHVGATAPNASPAGSAGNSTGEIWLDTSLTPVGVKIWNGSAFVNATPIGSTTVQGLLELATDAETQAGADTARAVTSASLQSKLSDSTSTTSNTTIASSTAVKAAYDLANAALPKTGGTVTGNLEIGTAGSLSFEGATADGFETTIAVVDPTADRTITLPNTTGTVVTTGDSGTVTSTMLLDGTIVDADINASAAIAYSKLASLTSANILVGNSSNVATSTAVTGDVTISNAGVTAISSGAIVNADVNASAAIAGSKISPDFGSQNVVTTGTSTAGSFTPTSTTVPAVGVYSPGANRLGITTNTVERVEFGTSEVVFNDDAADYDFRIEGDTNSNLFFADASAEAVGIRTATPVSELNVSVGNGGNITISNTNDAHSAGLAFGDTTSNSSGRISYDHSTNALAVATNGTGRLFVDASGNVGVGTGTTNVVGNTRVDIGIAGISNGLLTLRSAGGAQEANIAASATGLAFTTNSYATPFDARASEIIFGTGSSGTERLRITSAGLVGIGTTGPAERLVVANGNISHLLGTTSATVNALYDADTASNTYRINIKKDGTDACALAVVTQRSGGSASEAARIDSSGRLLVGTSSYTGNSKFAIVGGSGVDVALLDLRFGGARPTGADSGICEIRFGSPDQTSNNSYAKIECITDGASSSNTDIPGRLVFSTTADGAASPTPGLRIANNRQVDIYTNGGTGIWTATQRAAGTSDQVYQASYGATDFQTGTVSYKVYTNGNVENANNSYLGISDIKLKENIVDANSQWNDLKALQVRNFNFKEGQTHTQIGLIAQEVELVSPGLVNESPDRDGDGNDLGTVTKSVNYSVLYMKAVKALQEAMERIEQLETNNTDLLARVIALETA